MKSWLTRNFQLSIARVIASVLVLLSALLLSACSSEDKLSAPSYAGLVTISGSVEVAANTSVDLDVEQRCTELSPQNNSAGEAQQVSNPLTIGGYLNGSFRNEGLCDTFEQDLADYFRVSLVEGQNVGLSVFPAESSIAASNLNIDVSLSLSLVSDENTSLAAFSLNGGGAETLTVPQTGEYYVRVASSEGSDAVLYTLSLVQSLQASDARLFNAAVTQNFVPGEVLISLKSTATDQSKRDRSLSASLSTSSSSPAQIKASLSSKYDMQQKNTVGSISTRFRLPELASSSRYKVKASPNLSDSSELERKWQTLKQIEALKLDDAILIAEPNFLRRPTFIPNDTYYKYQWNLSIMNMTEAWDESTGVDVIVAVVDSGINPMHLDLRNQITDSGYDFIIDQASSGDGDGYDADPTDLSEAHHGSHVAGIIAAQSNNSRGIASVAFNAKIMPLRMLGVEDDEGNSEGSDADLANAILYAAGLENDSGLLPAQRADIINLSLGGSERSETLSSAISKALAAEVIVIAAAGNESSDENFYPAAFDGVVGVSAVTSNYELSSFSNFGSYIDVAAPGGSGTGQDANGSQRGILSTVFGNQYKEYLGTSMAAPHVSGVAALMKSLKPDLDPASFSYALENGFLSDVIGSADEFGYGLINAERAVDWAAGQNSIGDELYYFPKQLSFFNHTVRGKLYLDNLGSGSVVVSAVSPSTDDQAWIEVTQDVVDSSGLGSYDIGINSAAIPINTFRNGTLKVEYSVNGELSQEVSIDVLASNTISGSETVGNLYIFAMPADNAETQDISNISLPFSPVSGSLNAGRYDYRISNLPVGKYRIRASTDNDGDDILVDGGEASGLYLSPDNDDVLDADQETIGNLDFSVRFYESSISPVE